VASSTRTQPRDRQIQLCATASEEALIKAAAQREGVSVGDFIMRSACEKAEQDLLDQTHFVLDDKQWKAFMTALDEPPKDKPRLRRLLTEPHAAKRR
jgi:uncharacterized protein (DUF1778 family)